MEYVQSTLLFLLRTTASLRRLRCGLLSFLRLPTIIPYIIIIIITAAAALQKGLLQPRGGVRLCSPPPGDSSCSRPSLEVEDPTSSQLQFRCILHVVAQQRINENL